MKINLLFYSGITALLLLVAGAVKVNAQQQMGDNLGNHKATGNLNMTANTINNIQLTNAENIIIGTVGTVSNGAIALQINGSSKAMLVNRVTDLLNSGSPSIPTANAVEGMIVYDLATHKFYVRNNTGWLSYATGILPNGQIFIGDGSGNAQSITVTGDLTLSNAGVTAIGTSKVLTGKLADQSVTATKIAPGTANLYLRTNAAGTALEWAALPLGNYVDIVNRQATIKGFKTFTSDSGFVAGGTFGSGGTPLTTAGTRMIWHPQRAAFRAGTLASGGLSDANTGLYSAALGNSVASGEGAFSTNLGTASGYYSTAFAGCSASNNYSVAGSYSTASGALSTAFGQSTASGNTSVALVSSTASGSNSIAIGYNSIASGSTSTVLGYSCNAAGFSGGLTMGSVATSTANLQFFARFSAGYYFYTNSTATTGALVAAGGNSWSTVSDKRKKENFEHVNAELFLQKIDTLSLTSWNYKGQNPKKDRHYGPMAQDFYGAFGKDSYGTIGCDTLIASADIDGVNFIAVQGLVKRTNVLIKEMDGLLKEDLVLTKKREEEQLGFDAIMTKLHQEQEIEKSSIRDRMALMAADRKAAEDQLTEQVNRIRQRRTNDQPSLTK